MKDVSVPLNGELVPPIPVVGENVEEALVS
jgi:hypothetical protein